MNMTSFHFVVMSFWMADLKITTFRIYSRSKVGCDFVKIIIIQGLLASMEEQTADIRYGHVVFRIPTPRFFSRSAWGISAMRAKEPNLRSTCAPKPRKFNQPYTKIRDEQFSRGALGWQDVTRRRNHQGPQRHCWVKLQKQ